MEWKKPSTVANYETIQTCQKLQQTCNCDIPLRVPSIINATTAHSLLLSCEKWDGTYNIKFCCFVSGRNYRLKEGLAKEGSKGH